MSNLRLLVLGLLCATVAALLGKVPRAWGAAVYTAQADAYFSPSDSRTGPTPVSATTGLFDAPVGDPINGTINGRLTNYGAANANRGLIGSLGSVSLSNASLGIGSIIFYGNANATFSFDDIIVSAPGVPNPPSTVPISINMFLSGGYSTAIQLNNPGAGHGDFLGFGSSGIHLQLNTSLNGSNYVGGFDSSSNMDGSGNVTQSSSSFGLMNGFSGSGPVSLDQVQVPVNVPFSFSVNLTTNASITLQMGGTGPEEPSFTASAALSYWHSLPTHFTVPDGYTVNSPQAGIVDNTFTPPVPEPSAGALAGISLAGLLTCAWRRTAQCATR